MTPNGLIEFVHVHPEEHDEVLIIKKAMVSVFSAHVEVNKNTLILWPYLYIHYMQYSTEKRFKTRFEKKPYT